MRVLHINYSDSGGAGTAARRLHMGLVNSNLPSRFLCLHKSFNHSSIIDLNYTEQDFPPLHKIKNKFFRSLGLQNEKNNVKGKYEIFTSPHSRFDLTMHPAYQEADIINLHWVSNFLDYKSFFKKNKKPIVWTLHDMNPFQGGFHYYNDVINNQNDLGALEEKFKKIKKEALVGKENLHIVGLSNWILKQSINSEILGSFPHYLIPNGIDISVFKPVDKYLAREVFNLPADKTIILFVSENIDNRRKGFDLLEASLQELSHREDIFFCAVGTQNNSVKTNNLVFIESIKDERLMSILYSAVDVFILPSREDNLPNVMLEAMATGTPVVSTPVGGMMDVVIDNYNGLKSKTVSSQHLYEALIQFLDNKELYKRSDVRGFIKDNYSLSLQVSNYINLYSSILKQVEG